MIASRTAGSVDECQVALLARQARAMTVRSRLPRRRAAAPSPEELVDEPRSRVPGFEQGSDPVVQIVERATQESHVYPPHHSKVTIESTASAALFVPPWPFE